MKQSELVQLYVLFNKFKGECVKTDNVDVEKSFSLVDDWIDHEIQKGTAEGVINLL